ncbi:uncharacterized protein L3040_003797 [Drepanopeziza brunnea f. sp. 'multigermtubi']|uniref:VanZ like family protein n=1 Tax=Marssonina brunnea f. sp. multigermtubi (strain MB_m1) TaxID=1072389 RepID=K1WCA4_MARBU|nr:VanZ like family protein [Drepanopeziza brunnea f. sp. 'multigermtubi' MB_m1]EKD15005.1 VanZ like family protein [Drepanopeziza brunnea f. sp. 'multigermtubi' MB_m1]KAJ5046558.1 hypothetical protein L3040_003797 [Drepanopeziza brunnea f. sp. 'multigermtubi']
MRIRLPFAGAFIFLCLTAAYAGLSSLQVNALINDKLLHALTLFILTTSFYWILDTSRRRTLNLTLGTCTCALGIGSEFLQGALPNGGSFDVRKIVANVVGSLAALALSTWYHVRMLERKRLKRGYGLAAAEEQDLELGEGVGLGVAFGEQSSGVVVREGAAGVAGAKTLDQEVENWDENLETAWDDDEHAAESADGDGGMRTPSASSAGDGEGDGKRRAE